jgi:hypothetical protein
MIRSENSKLDLINISELLEIFDLDLNLPNEVLNAKVDACLKLAKLNVGNDSYEFKYDDYIVRIYPSESRPIFVEETGKDAPCFYYNSKGNVYKIT